MNEKMILFTFIFCQLVAPAGFSLSIDGLASMPSLLIICTSFELNAIGFNLPKFNNVSLYRIVIYIRKNVRIKYEIAVASKNKNVTHLKYFHLL